MKLGRLIAPAPRLRAALPCIAMISAALAACTDAPPMAPRSNAAAGDARLAIDRRTLAQQVRILAAGRGVVPLPRPPHVRPELARLGRMLAFDKILSGNRNISCMSCHLPGFATGDGRSLPIGTGGVGLGPARALNAGAIIPRNAPPLFNLHAMPALFWDGRVSVDAGGHFHTPADTELSAQMTEALEFGAMSAQGLFPVLSHAEMRGTSGSHLSELPDADMQRIWRALMQRLGRIPKYRRMFEAAYPGTRFEDMTFANATNAMAGFFITDFTYDRSPWDRFLAGDNDALTLNQLLGAKDFMSLKCSICHNGATFSDGQFHDVALAQFGPGEGVGQNGRDDFGRFDVTNDPADRYRFRTTPLRNVEISGPYGHAGQFKSLRDFIAHYSESDVKLRSYDPSQIDPILGGSLLNNVDGVLAARDTLLTGVVIPDSIVVRLTTYMQALTDPRVRRIREVTPDRVPSGLPVDGN